MIGCVRVLPVAFVALACAALPLPGREEGGASGSPPSTAAPPELRPRLETSEREVLLDRARRDIARAERLVASVETARLTPDERERLDLTHDLLGEARLALEAGDALKASSLAEKAGVLAEDLAPD